MDFHEGDPVMHWTYGLGQVVRLEEQALSGPKALYYAVQIGDLTVWVPADGKLETRLRPPTPELEFRQVLDTLSNPSEPLPEDRLERRSHLLELLKDGRAESLCQVVRDLSAHQKTRSLNDSDQMLLKKSRSTLLGEWVFVLSITPAQAELELQHRLAMDTLEVEK